MASPWKAEKIAACKASIRELLREIDTAGDLDLWEEADGKLSDAVVVYRRAQRGQPEPTTFTFSDGVTRDIDAMAAVHAVNEVFDDEWPAYMQREV